MVYALKLKMNLVILQIVFPQISPVMTPVSFLLLQNQYHRTTMHVFLMLLSPLIYD